MISEFAIPFAAGKPLLYLPCFMAGSAVGAILSYTFGLTMQAPHGGFKGPNNANLPDMRGIIKDFARQGCTDDIGAWPVNGPEARLEPQAVYAVRDWDKLNNITGTAHPMLMRFITSNDYGHFGEFILPAGGYGPRCSDPDVHAGDGAIYCVDGPVTINLVDLQESYQLEPEDSFFLPVGTKYQLVNFQAKPAKCVFAITAL